MNITRRTTLKGGTAVVACAVAAMPTITAGPEDPVLVLRRERKRLHARICGLPNTNEGDEIANILVHDLCRAEVRILETEPQTLAGALAQVEQLCLWEEDGVVIGGDVAIQRLIEILPARIECLAGRAQS